MQMIKTMFLMLSGALIMGAATAYAQTSETSESLQTDTDAKPSENQVAAHDEHADMKEPQSDTAKTAQSKKALTDDVDNFFGEIEQDAENGDLDQGCSIPENVA